MDNVVSTFRASKRTCISAQIGNIFNTVYAYVGITPDTTMRKYCMNGPLSKLLKFRGGFVCFLNSLLISFFNLELLIKLVNKHCVCVFIYYY